MIITRRARFEDLEEMLAVEKAAISSLYLSEVYEDFFSDEIGEMIVAEEDGVIYGFGKITIQYDGSAWLELLRVHPNYQNKGAGKAIWKRFLEVAAIRQPKYIRMYTGTKNVVSRHIAELNGVNRAYEFSECSKEVNEKTGDDNSFKPVEYEELIKLLPEIRFAWGSYVCFNRTFYSLDGACLKALCKEGKVYTDGESIMALGARFMPERGINIVFILGDTQKCIAFAMAEAKRRNTPKVVVMHRAANGIFKAQMDKLGFTYLPSNLLMLEGDFA